MKLLVIGSGLMGSAAAYDMARSNEVKAVTLADNDIARARAAAKRINALTRSKKVKAVALDAAKPAAAKKLMKGHAGVLSAVPYFYNLGLCKAAIESGCNFADLGGNNTVVKKEYALSKQAAKKRVAIAPDCGLSPGMASILGGELLRRIGGKADALKIYVGGLPKDPQPPFLYHLVFSVEGLINEYVEPAKILRNGKIQIIEPLTETEDFVVEGFPTLTAFHTSGGTSTMPENFHGKVGECFEKTLRYPSHFQFIRMLYDLGAFSSEKKKFGKVELSPRQMTSRLFLDKWTSDAPDVTIMRVEAVRGNEVLRFTMVDYYDNRLKMTSMMKTTAWPAAIVLMMMCNGEIDKRGGIYQETDVPAERFLEAMMQRGVMIQYEGGKK